MAITFEWRGAFTNAEVNALHAEAFETPVFVTSRSGTGPNWSTATASAGW